MSEAFHRAWARTGRAEGGYVDHPDDPGGPTNHGITERVARAHGYFGDMRDLPGELALRIAKADYWDRLRLDEIAALSEVIAQELFDTNLNLWDGAAGKFLQRGLNALNRGGRDYEELSVDGVIGPKTIATLAEYLALRAADDGEEVLLKDLNIRQGADYARQCEETLGKEQFYFGWLRHRISI